MSNSIAPGSSADVNVKVTALTTNPNVPVTYKTIILKKNLVNGVNTLTQEMMSITNTKYIVKYDYVLGENITVPDNCILEFDGGSLSGAYTITGSNTGINAELVKIFSTDIILAGSWNVNNIYSEWFIFNNNDCSKQFANINILSNNGNTNIYLNNSVYNVLPTSNYSNLIILKSNTSLYLIGTINIQTNSVDYNIIYIKDAKNVSVFGGNLKGDVSTHSSSTEGGSGVYVDCSENITVKDITVGEIWGDGIYIGQFGNNSPQNILISNSTITKNRRNGISVTAGEYVYIENCKILDNATINGTNPKSAIDIEENDWTYCDHIFINNIISNGNMYFTKHINHSPSGRIIRLSNSIVNNLNINNNCVIDNCDIYDMIINYDNAKIKNSTIQTFIIISASNIEIRNCTFNNISRAAGYIGLINIDSEVHNITFENNTLYFPDAGYRNSSSVLPTNSDKVDLVNCTIIGTDNWFIWMLGDIIKCNLSVGRMMLNNNTFNIINNTIRTRGLNFVAVENTSPSGFIQNNVIIPGEENTYQMLFVYSGVNLSNLKLLNNKCEKFDVGSSRPNFMTSAEIGKEFFDTTLNKPIYWNGTAWVDATGTTV